MSYLYKCDHTMSSITFGIGIHEISEKVGVNKKSNKRVQ